MINVDGVINLDKSTGVSSQYAVNGVKRLFHNKAGHCGTLDPMASGVLPVCLGKATRLSPYIMGQKKTYVAEICFGVETDSYDADGAVLRRQNAAFVCRQMVEGLFPHYLGEIMQAPPAVSALKQGGEALYKKARRGETVQIPKRPVMIYALRMLDFQPGEQPIAKVEVTCGQGAYIRSLAHDMGAELGTGASLISLRRLQVGDFTAEKAYTLAELQAMSAEELTKVVQPMTEALAHLPVYSVSAEQAPALAHGNAVEAAGDLPSSPCRVEFDGQLLGIGYQKEGLLQMDKVLVEQDAFDDLRQFSVLAAGTFDGLHLGHRQLFQEAARLRAQLGGNMAALTFDIHPLQLIKGRAPALLTCGAVKKDLIRRSFSADGMITLHFDQEMMDMEPEAFVEKILLQRYGVKAVVVGFNYSFGKGGKGDPQMLKEICAAHGVQVSVVPEVTSPYGTISSTNIRRHLAAGDIVAVNAMLGYWLTLEGKVEKSGGYGFALAQALPPDGLYGGRVSWAEETFAVCIRFIQGKAFLRLENHGLALPKKIRLYIGAAYAENTPEEEIFAALTGIAKNKHLPKRI